MCRDLDVLLDSEIGHKVVELEDEAELAAAVLAEVLARKRSELAVTDRDRATVGALEAADEIQEGRLARARGAEHDADFAAVHGGGYAVEHLDAGFAVAVVLGKALDDEVGGI